MDQIDIERSATGMIRNYGAGAALHAEQVARRLQSRDNQGSEVWLTIARTIRRLEQAGS